jgi:hypothetical protein
MNSRTRVRWTLLLGAALMSRQSRGPGRCDRSRRHRRRRHERQRAGSGRVGDRRNHGAADAVRAHRGDRRPRPLRLAGSAERDVQVFVRGYGLVDSPRQTAKPGQQLNLRAEVAPDAKSAAQVYPAAWWFSMIKPPAAPDQQVQFERLMKECYDCHQLGNKATRELAPYLSDAKTSLEAKLCPPTLCTFLCDWSSR